MKMLIWKEWRETRSIPIWFSLLLGLLMVATKSLNLIEESDTLAYLWMSWLLAGVFAASGLISREVGNGTLQFLMALPVSRRRAWTAKLVAGLVTLLLCILLTSFVWVTAQTLLYGSLSQAVDLAVMTCPVGLGGLAAGCLLAAIGCFFVGFTVSALLDRSISAAMVGIVLMVGLLIPLGFTASEYQFAVSTGGQAGDMTFVNLVILGFLSTPAFILASYLAFTRGESLRTRRRFTWAAIGLGIGLVATVVPALSLFSGLTRFQRYHSVLKTSELSPDGHYLAEGLGSIPIRYSTGVAGDPRYQAGTYGFFLARHLVIERVDGATKPIVLPDGAIMAWSPDSRHLVYNRLVGPFGLGLGAPALTWVDTETGRMRSFDFGHDNSTRDHAEFSPDGRWLVLASICTANDPTICFFRTDDQRNVLSPAFTASMKLGDPNGTGTNSVVVYAGDRRRHISGYGAESWVQPGVPRIAWDRSSRYLYIMQRNQLLAVDTAPSIDQKRRTPFVVCTMDESSQSVILTVTDNPHRALVSIAQVKAVIPDQSWLENEPRLQRDYVVDLAALVEKAENRSAQALVPSLDQWLSSAGLYADDQCLSASTITRDGRYVLRRRVIARTGKTGHKGLSTMSLVAAVDLDHPTAGPRELAAAYLPKGYWLLDGHRWLQGDGHLPVAGESSPAAVIDPSGAPARPVSIPPGDMRLDLDSEGRLVLWPPMSGANADPERTLPDAFNLGLERVAL